MSTPRREQCLKCGAIRPEKHGLGCPDNPDPVEPTPSPEQFARQMLDFMDNHPGIFSMFNFLVERLQAYADLVSKRLAAENESLRGQLDDADAENGRVQLRISELEKELKLLLS